MQKISRRSLAIGIALLSIPSFVFIWLNRDIPHFGIIEDDGLYLIGAKTIAEGAPYRILSLPGEPYQSKYPPAYPLYLAIAWKAGSTLASRMALALILNWLCLPAAMILFHLWLRRHGFNEKESWLLTALFGLNPYILFFTSNLISEISFIAVLLAMIHVAERRHAAAAGALGGLAYLLRTAGIAILPAAILYYLWVRRPRKAAWFTAGMLPAILGWTLWSRAHTPPGHDVPTLYYTNYFAYQLYNVGLDNVHLVVWQNVSLTLESFGSFVFPQMIQGLPAKMILQPIGLAMILGCVRMFRRQPSLYATFGLTSTAVLLIWHGTPNQRLVLPLAPLLLAGFWTEAVHFWGLVRKALNHPDRSQRVVAYGFTGFVGLIIATGLALQIYMWANVIPGMARDDRANARAYASVYRWIEANTPVDANILWEVDTALYFATGRHSLELLIPPREWYATGNDRDIEHFRKIDEYARENKLSYVVLPNIGPHRNPDYLAAVKDNRNLEQVHEEAGGVVYKLR